MAPFFHRLLYTTLYLVVSKTTCFFAPKYNKNLDFKGNLK